MRLVSAKARPFLATATLVALFLMLLAVSRSDAKPEPDKQEVTEIAKEIVKIQEEMGGSVVDLPSANLDPPSLSAEPMRAEASARGGSDEPILALREAGLQLDLVAHRLELLDLYTQADATRELAKRLREDARNLRRAGVKAKME